VKDEVVKILEEIEESGGLSKKIIENVLNFNLYSLLNVSEIRPIKRDIYKSINLERPNLTRRDSLKKNNKQFCCNILIITDISLLMSFLLKFSIPFRERRI
jgi:hypothetical protein